MMLRSVCTAMAAVPPPLLCSLCLHRGPGSPQLVLHARPGTPLRLPARAAPGGRAPSTLGPDGEAWGQAHTDSPFSHCLFQGFVPAAVRLIPQTVLTFIFLEQLRKHFGMKVTT